MVRTISAHNSYIEINEDMVQILLMLEILSHRIITLKICSVMLLPALSPACSSAFIFLDLGFNPI